jgi:phytoene dehydrogenase-like protein
VLADVDAPTLYRRLVGEEHLSRRLREDLANFQWDNGTVKVNWALDRKIPWRHPGCAGAGTVHLGGPLDELSEYSHALAIQRIPARPFLIVGQMTTADPARSPEGTESAWAYTHVPWSVRGDAGGSLRGDWSDEAERAAMVQRVEDRMEEFAPGFRDAVVGRHVQFPNDLYDDDGNLVGGAVNGGTAWLHQELVFRPVPGLARPETVIEGLYLASASAHPGGGVHGGPGANAARAALHAATAGRVVTALQRRLG